MAIFETNYNPSVQAGGDADKRERQRVYMREYFARRYANDAAFRERHRANNKARYARLKELAAIGAAASASNATGAGNGR